MSKGNVILGYARGSIGDVTLARVKGQQIARARNRNPKNPKSPAQMTQRIKFAPVTKFYMQGKSGLLPFSFANKKALESDFNAFMRENLKSVSPIYPTQEELNNIKMWLPNTYVLANGNKANIKVWDITGEGSKVVELPADYKTTTSWDSFLALHPEVSIGDIITGIFINYNARLVGGVVEDLGLDAPVVEIHQFTIGEQITDNMRSFMNARGFFANDLGEGTSPYIVPSREIEWSEEGAQGIAWYTSKVTEGTTEEAFVQIQLNVAAMDIVAELSAEDHLGRALVSWGAGEAAILQGSLSGDVR